MTLDKFCREYDTAGDKDKFVKSVVNVNYIPVVDKIAVCQKIIVRSCYDDNGKFMVNSVKRYLLFIASLIKLYTDIQIDNNFMETYDELFKRDVISKIIASIPKNEYSEFSTILSMTLDDEYDNKRNIVGYIDSKVDLVAKAFEEIGDIYGREPEEDREQIRESIG